MKKFLILLMATTIVLSSCVQNPPLDNSENPENPVQPNVEENPKPVSKNELSGSTWFFGDNQLQFPYANETLYIKYLPDGLNVSRWISLKEKSDGTFESKIEWSENVREIGKTFETSITKKGETLFVENELFNFSSMEKFEGVTASEFNVNEVPALKSEYLSNFSGSYKLKKTNYDLTVGAKLGISKSTTNYWNANVLNAIVNDDGTYDLLLAHSSQNNGSGSIDPGITGKEPFVSRQGLFWSHLTLTPEPGSLWNVKWSSTWFDSPYEALQATMDCEDSFQGPATTKLVYKYHFYFGNPTVDEKGNCAVAKGDLIKYVTYESDLPTKENWKQILARAGEIKIPEGKVLDYWWYSTNSITSIESSYVYKLRDDFEPSLKEYEFYAALKDKPNEANVYYQEGTFVNGTKSIVITSSSLTYNDGTDEATYQFLSGATWSTAKDGVSPLNYVYLLKNGEQKYLGMIAYYTNNDMGYIKIRPPKEFDGDEIPAEIDWSGFNALVRTQFAKSDEN